MGYTRFLLMAIIVAMTTEKAWGYISYDVQSTIIGLMDQRGYTALQKVRLTRDNVRPIFRKDISGKVRNKRALVMLFFGTRQKYIRPTASAPYLIIPYITRICLESTVRSLSPGCGSVRVCIFNSKRSFLQFEIYNGNGLLLGLENK